MALQFAQRTDLARQPGEFADRVTGALRTHALHRQRTIPVPGGQTQDDYDLAVALLADVDRYIRPVLGMVLHSAEQAGLEDVTSLDDLAVLTMVETLWPSLVVVAARLDQP